MTGVLPGGPRSILVEMALAQGAKRCILAGVQRMIKMVALLLTVIWPLAVSHCALENLPSLSFLACTDGCCETQHEPDAKEDACAIVESGFYKSDSNRLVVAVPPAVLICLIELDLDVLKSFAASPIAPESSPPELSQLWQFSFRAALSPRAPSFVS